MNWRVLPLHEYSAAMNMAIDEALSEQVAKGGAPIIRFYTWQPSAISIGYFQSLHDEVDVAKCQQLDVHIVRRRTGGGAVYHDKELTYSIIAKQDLFPKNIIASYQEICGWIIQGLERLQIKADFKPINDIITNGKKISGNAQTRRNGVLLQHGTLLYDVDVDKMFSLLKVPDEKIRDKLIATVKERVTSITQQSDVSFDQVYRAMLHSFTQGKNTVTKELTKQELQRAQDLVDTRYATVSWNEFR